MPRKARNKTLEKPVGRAIPASKPAQPAPLPVAARVLLALAVLSAVLYAGRILITPVASGDLWFHLKAGEWILHHHRMPPGDLFSATHKMEYWVVNAWLSEIILYAIYTLGGATGVFVFRLVVALGILATVAHCTYRISRKPMLAVLCAFLPLIVGHSRFNVRPEIFSLALIVATMAILYSYKLGRSDRTVWLIPMGVLWPNLHMGFTSGAAIAGCFLLGEGIAAALSPKNREGVISGKRYTKLLWVSAATLAATLINPYGLDAWLFVSKLSGQLGTILEWKPLFEAIPGVGYAPLYCLGVMAAIAGGALIFSHRPKDITGLLLVIAFGYMALKFNRQIAQFCLVAPFVAAVAAKDLPSPLFSIRRISGSLQATLAAGLVLVFIFGLFLLLVVKGIPEQISLETMGFGLDKIQASDRAMQFIRDNGLIGGKLFNSLESGGWMIWRLGPEQKMFIDGRSDLYGLDPVNQFLGIAASPNVADRLNRMKIDYCYFRYPQGREAVVFSYPAQVLAHHPDWALVHFDDAGTIYVRREPRYEKLIAKSEYQIFNPYSSGRLESQDLSGRADRVIRESDQTLRDSPDSARAHMAAGIALYCIGRPTESIGRLETALRVATHWSPGVMGVVEEYIGRDWMDAKNPRNAAEHFRKSIAHFTEIGDRQRLAVLHNRLGAALEAAGNREEAQREYQAARELGQ